MGRLFLVGLILIYLILGGQFRSYLQPLLILFAVPFALYWGLTTDESLSPIWIFVYGVATTAASWLFVYPCMGFGVFGRLSPDGTKAMFSSLANHIFYGIGLALGIAFI